MNRPFVSFLLTLNFKRGANNCVIKRLSESKTKSRMTSKHPFLLFDVLLKSILYGE